MGFFSKLFQTKYKKTNPIQVKKTSRNPECELLLNLDSLMDSLLKADKYIAENEYRDTLKRGKKVFDYFSALKSNRLLNTYCENNFISLVTIEDTLNKYKNFQSLVDEHNKKYVQVTVKKEKNCPNNSISQTKFENPNLVQEKKTSRNPECKQLLDLHLLMDSLLKADKYVAKSEYRDTLKRSERVIDYFSVLKSSQLLNTYCVKNSISLIIVEDTLNKYKKFESLVDEHNDTYVQETMKKEKNYLDNILYEVDPIVKLDNDQRKVVLTDEDYCLVIAGAGAGKTTTVAARVKYLVEKKNIDPKQILVVSFTNKAVHELQDKINTNLHIDCPITTFHSAGNAILRKKSLEKLNIVDQSKLYYIVQDYFKKSILQNERLVNNLILFFASYFDAPYEGKDLNAFFEKVAKSNYSTLKSDFNEFKEDVVDHKSKKKVTIQNEVLRSYQEVEIANFLYLNGIDYQYEPLYQYDIPNAKKPYTPDFIIKQGNNIAYIEHFGITQDGKNDRFSDDQIAMYKRAINDKILLHRSHKTKLIYTFSQYNDRRSLLEHLKENLLKNGFQLHPRSNKEIIEKLVSNEENRYIRKLVNLICRFIHNFKTNGYTIEDFDRMSHSTTNVRSKLFLDICSECYLEYQQFLKENNFVDFEDMINESARLLREAEEMKQKLDFKYIIVDEYQDISRQRFDLVTALSKVTNAKIMAVGDDWQSIYAFSGSDITLFTKFQEKMGYAKLLKIVNTYRNSQEVIDIAGNFIQKNESQIKKDLKSPKNIKDPVIIYTYDSKKPKKDNKSGSNYELAHAVEVALEQIIEFNRQEGKSGKSSILLLGRYGFDGDKLEKSGLFEYVRHGNKLKSVKYPKLDISFMTVHASKGLGYDNVIILNCKNETFGFPSKIEDDPILSFVIKGDHSIDYAEERRLFYVALTRTKNRVFCIAPEQNPSEFLLEIKKDYKNVVLRGNWNSDNPRSVARKPCPKCGFPMQYRYKNAYGLRLFLCTNEPEICGFMTNEYKAGDLSIMKCDKCRDGYLIVKPGKDNHYFLGCTNYKKDGTGCNRVINSNNQYLESSINQQMVDRTKAYMPIPTKEQITKSAPKKEFIQIQKADITGVTYQGKELDEIVHMILQCYYHISETKYYGVHRLVDVLRGAHSKQVVNAYLDKVPEYGALKDLCREDLMTIIDWLIDNHYLLKTQHPMYPVLHPTYEGLHYSETITKNQLQKLNQLLTNNGVEFFDF